MDNEGYVWFWTEFWHHSLRFKNCKEENKTEQEIKRVQEHRNKIIYLWLWMSPSSLLLQPHLDQTLFKHTPYRCAHQHIQIRAGLDYEYVITYGLHYWEQRFIQFSKDHQEYAVMTPKTTQASALISNHREVRISQTPTEIDCPV